MTIRFLIDELADVYRDATKDFVLPTALQKGDTERVMRAPEIYKMRLVKSSEAKKAAPYIIIQAENGIDRQEHGKPSGSNVTVFSTFCVYCEDEQEGALMLLNLIDAVRIRLLRQVVIGGRFRLDTDAGVEYLIFREDTAPYYGGVITATFEMPPSL